MKDLFNIVQSITAILAVIIAIISIRYTTKSLREQKKHDVLTVKPIINVGIVNYVDSISIFLFNKGMGPATIQKVEISYCCNGENIVRNSIMEIINSIHPNYTLSDGFTDLTGLTFLPNESINIFSIERTQNTNHKEIEQVLAFITGHFWYIDLYENVHKYEFDLKRIISCATIYKIPY